MATSNKNPQKGFLAFLGINKKRVQNGMLMPVSAQTREKFQQLSISVQELSGSVQELLGPKRQEPQQKIGPKTIQLEELKKQLDEISHILCDKLKNINSTKKDVLGDGLTAHEDIEQNIYDKINLCETLINLCETLIFKLSSIKEQIKKERYLGLGKMIQFKAIDFYYKDTPDRRLYKSQIWDGNTKNSMVSLQRNYTAIFNPFNALLLAQNSIVTAAHIVTDGLVKRELALKNEHENAKGKLEKITSGLPYYISKAIRFGVKAAIEVASAITSAPLKIMRGIIHVPLLAVAAVGSTVTTALSALRRKIFANPVSEGSKNKNNQTEGKKPQSSAYSPITSQLASSPAIAQQASAGIINNVATTMTSKFKSLFSSKKEDNNNVLITAKSGVVVRDECDHASSEDESCAVSNNKDTTSETSCYGSDGSTRSSASNPPSPGRGTF